MGQSYDAAQGHGWNDGLNRMIQAGQLKKHVAPLIAHGLGANGIEVTPTDAQKGRGLFTTKGKCEGEVLLKASALFHDSKDSLEGF